MEEKPPSLRWQYETGKLVRESRELFLNSEVFVETAFSMKVPDAAYSTSALEVLRGLARGLGLAACSRECRDACIHVEVVYLLLNFC